MYKYLNIVIKLLSLGVVIVAAGLWAGAGVHWRPKRRDEQTLVGGTIWSQLIIPFGLIMSLTIHENIDLFVHLYYLLSGVALCFATGVVLLIQEYKTSKKLKARQYSGSRIQQMMKINNFSKVYLFIGILSIIAGLLKLTDFILLVVI